MKKLYLANRNHSVMFLSNGDEKELVMNDANHWMNEQDSYHTPKVELIEIKVPDQIPEEWRDGFIWGTNEEMTAAEFLQSINASNEEYQEYLRLKAKYE
jgi:hypothetical protein